MEEDSGLALGLRVRWTMSRRNRVQREAERSGEKRRRRRGGGNKKRQKGRQKSSTSWHRQWQAFIGNRCQQFPPLSPIKLKASGCPSLATRSETPSFSRICDTPGQPCSSLFMPLCRASHFAK
ncbi:hypothetical protein QLX08_007979 [Tetragonisca angustula]|uniref:Uncharacterized protein n=1 Tax=Tetragonisca angustula TaxID=166442 RepID=A0AAW0ZMD7_9HYME